MGSDNYSGEGRGDDSPSESRGGPGAGAGSSSAGSSKGSSSSGGGLNSSGNRASGAGPGASANRSTSSNNGGLNSAGNRASGAGPGASGNRSTTGGGYSGSTGNSNANGGGSGMGGGLNSAGNRASGAGPGASGNRSTTGNGYGGGPSFGGQNSPRGMASGMTDSARRADMAQAARASENASMSTYNAARSLSDDNARRADLAQQARTAETKSMKDLSRERALGTISTAEVGKKDPYNTLSGGLIGDITSLTVKEAVALAGTKWKGKVASVLGAYQFKNSTLADVATKMGLLDAKMTPQVQDALAVGLMQHRANLATIDGKIDVDKFARELSREWASLATPSGLSHYDDNGIDKASVSYAKTRDIAESLIANGVVSAGKSVGSVTSKDASSVQTKAPGLGRFNSTYMGGKTASPAEKNAATTQEAAKTQQNDPSGLPKGTYPAYDPSGLPPEKPAAPAPAKPRSMGQKVAAGAIDIGLGMLPGVGTAVSVVNGGLALTGNRTLGERAVDSFVNGEGGAGPNSGADRAGGSGKDQVVKDTSTVPAKTESFEDRYIKFVDPTQRPTPAQKWNYDTPGYA